MVKEAIVDCKDHMLGRLASVVAKELLNGSHVVLLRCEKVNISGGFYRNKVKYLDFLHKRTVHNHTRGPIHFRAPSEIVKRTIRGMIPHKTARGAAALTRLQCYDGVPPVFETRKRVTIPQAYRVLRLKPYRRYATLGRIAEEIGWKYGDTIRALEGKRAARGALYRKNKLAKRTAKIPTKVDAQLAKLGY